MIWLASFPRSGNTFFRNIMYQVYGLESSSYHQETVVTVDENFESYPIVKTHLLPDQLPNRLQSAKSVYLVRDGRDALVSMAHHRKDIIAPGSNYYWNLTEAILAREGSFFGGWGGNVEAWMDTADIVIKYEDLIKDPLKEVRKLSQIMELPDAKVDNLPTFSQLKKGKAHYGSGAKRINKAIKGKEFSDKFFRRGVSGSYKDEMPHIHRALFWMKNRKQMQELKYY